jgi:phage terminase small subunit
MPIARKSLAELQLSGTYQRNKRKYDDRLNPVATILPPIGTAPRHLQATERAVWAEVVRSAPEGLLGRPDRIALEVATRLIVKMRTGDYKPSDVGALLNVFTKLGMTPAARQKLNLQPPATPATSELTAEEKVWAELDALD